MVERVVDEQFRGRLDRVRCLDVGCHEGYYSVAMAPKGMREVRGIDVRQSSLTKARFVAELVGLKNVTYEECNIEDLSSEIGPYDLCLCLGLLYHLENPVLTCARSAASPGRYASSKPRWSTKWKEVQNGGRARGPARTRAFWPSSMNRANSTTTIPKRVLRPSRPVPRQRRSSSCYGRRVSAGRKSLIRPRTPTSSTAERSASSGSHTSERPAR
ncbi:MAG: methyltransferase domain-containing protein [Acidobacteriota bacterium]|nr:methyltransferase domain-containing protein [Acidobacteriota bacterium]